MGFIYGTYISLPVYFFGITINYFLYVIPLNLTHQFLVV